MLAREDAAAFLVQNAVVEAMVPGPGERAYFDLLGDRSRMDEISIANAAARDMADIRPGLGAGWKILAGGVAVAAVGLAVAGRAKSASAMGGLAAAAIGGVAWVEYGRVMKYRWSRLWSSPTTY